MLQKRWIIVIALLALNLIDAYSTLPLHPLDPTLWQGRNYIRAVTPNGTKLTLRKDDKTKGFFAFLRDEEEKYLSIQQDLETPDGIRVERETRYAPEGRLKLFILSANNLLYPIKNHIFYTYDAHGRIIEIQRGNPEISPEIQTYKYKYDFRDRLIEKVEAGGTPIHYQYDTMGRLARLWADQNLIDYTYTRDHRGRVLQVCNAKGESVFTREIEGAVRKEVQGNGHIITTTVDEQERPLIVDLGQWGQIHYQYEGEILVRIARYDAEGQLQYEHNYLEVEDGNVLSEDLIYDLGRCSRRAEDEGRRLVEDSPYHNDYVVFDDNHNVVEHKGKVYHYDTLGQMKGFDGLQNPKGAWVNNLNQVVNYQGIEHYYSAKGNLVCKQDAKYQVRYHYDVLNRLIAVKSGKTAVRFCYDSFGRRMRKQIRHNNEIVDEEQYLYQGLTEIGAVDREGRLRALRVIHPKTERAIAIELQGKPYAPLYDLQGNVKYLLDPETRQIACTYTISPFGNYIKQEGKLGNPWFYLNKRWDPEVALYYFEQRYYDPLIFRWITPDSYTECTSFNQYAFLNNNPFLYKDPNGRSIRLSDLPVLYQSCCYILGGAIALAAGKFVYEHLWYTAFFYYYEYVVRDIKEATKYKTKLDQALENAKYWLNMLAWVDARLAPANTQQPEKEYHLEAHSG